MSACASKDRVRTTPQCAKALRVPGCEFGAASQRLSPRFGRRSAGSACRHDGAPPRSRQNAPQRFRRTADHSRPAKSTENIAAAAAARAVGRRARGNAAVPHRTSALFTLCCTQRAPASAPRNRRAKTAALGCGAHQFRHKNVGVENRFKARWSAVCRWGPAGAGSNSPRFRPGAAEPPVSGLGQVQLAVLPTDDDASLAEFSSTFSFERAPAPRRLVAQPARERRIDAAQDSASFLPPRTPPVDIFTYDTREPLRNNGSCGVSSPLEAMAQPSRFHDVLGGFPEYALCVSLTHPITPRVGRLRAYRLHRQAASPRSSRSRLPDRLRIAKMSHTACDRGAASIAARRCVNVALKIAFEHRMVPWHNPLCSGGN